jgi:exonuclease VII small subunit
MSPAPDAPVELSFGAAYERLQEVAAELSADASMPPERLIALLKEGKGLERALRDHLDRIEQEVRAIDEGEGATPFRIVDAGAPAPATPSAAPSAAPAPAAGSPAPAAGAPAAPAPAERTPAPDAAPTLGFPGADDDIPF